VKSIIYLTCVGKNGERISHPWLSPGRPGW